MKALIVIDVQHDFLPGGSLAVDQGDQIIPVINGLIDPMDLIVATQDWHPQNHISFVSNHEGKKPFESIPYQGTEQTLWPDHCVQGTPGAEFPDSLRSDPIEVIFRKGTDPKIDSYSGFYDNQHLKSTGLADYLKGKGITELYLTGLAGDVCVYFTALDALAEGFKVVVVKDGAMPLDATRFEEQLKELKTKGAEVKLAKEI